MSEVANRSEPPREDPSVAVVEVEPGVAVLYADILPEGLDLIPLDLLGSADQAALSSAISVAAGFGNVAAQAASGVAQAQGLIRLAPETMKLLQTAQPLTSGGWNLGTLANQGKIVAQVRWLPATSASAMSVAASTGPAVALLAVQVQLAQIAKSVQHNIDLTSQVMKAVRQEHWAQATGDYKTLNRELANARHIGAVTDAVWTNVRGREADLRTRHELFTQKVEDHVRQLKGKKDHKQRREFLIDNGEAIIADAHALLLAQNSWFIYTALRVAHLANSASKDERDAALVEKLVADARSDYAATTEMTWLLLTALANEFGVMAELEGKRTFVVGGQRRAARQVYRMVEQLLSALEAAIGREGLAQRPAPKSPQTSVFEKGAPKELLSVLRFRLGHDEQVLAAADVTCDLWRWDVRDAGWAVLTDERLLVTKQDTFRRLGTIDVAVPVEDVRFVRVERRRDKGAKLHVATKDANFEIVFRDWAARGRRKDSAQQFADAVASFMNLPADEIPPRPQLARSSTDIQGLPPAPAGSADAAQAERDTPDDPGQSS